MLIFICELASFIVIQNEHGREIPKADNAKQSAGTIASSENGEEDE